MGARCIECPLRDRPAVGPSPSVARPLLALVGEAPGKVEEKLGRPFVGRSGQLVDKLLAEANVTRTNTYLTNAALCRGERDKDTEKAMLCCAPRLLKELGELPPETPIATLGRHSTESVLNYKEILKARGFVWKVPEIDYSVVEKRVLKAPVGPRRDEVVASLAIYKLRHKLAGRVVLPTIHPAFVLRSETWHPIIRIDFRRMGRAVFRKLAMADSGVHIVTTQPRELLKLGRVVSLDVETTEAKHPLLAELLCVGLSDGKRTVVLWPWFPRLAKPLTGFLRTRKEVVGHNLIQFDREVLAQHGVGP